MTSWIAVADKLPPLHQIVVLAHNDRWMNSMAHDAEGLNWYGVGYLDERSNKYWNIIGETRSQCLDAVTHWMPLEVVPQ